VIIIACESPKFATYILLLWTKTVIPQLPTEANWLFANYNCPS